MQKTTTDRRLKKLTLKKLTIRELTPKELKIVDGGGGTGCDDGTQGSNGGNGC
jgi:natural product precursor